MFYLAHGNHVLGDSESLENHGVGADCEVHVHVIKVEWCFQLGWESEDGRACLMASLSTHTQDEATAELLENALKAGHRTVKYRVGVWNYEAVFYKKKKTSKADKQKAKFAAELQELAETRKELNKMRASGVIFGPLGVDPAIHFEEEEEALKRKQKQSWIKQRRIC